MKSIFFQEVGPRPRLVLCDLITSGLPVTADRIVVEFSVVRDRRSTITVSVFDIFFLFQIEKDTVKIISLLFASKTQLLILHGHPAWVTFDNPCKRIPKYSLYIGKLLFTL